MRHVKPSDITPDLLERCLDQLAFEIDRAGPEKGLKALPIFERIEKELAALRAKDDAMASVRDRLSRSRDRKATRSS